MVNIFNPIIPRHGNGFIIGAVKLDIGMAFMNWRRDIYAKAGRQERGWERSHVTIPSHCKTIDLASQSICIHYVHAWQPYIVCIKLPNEPLVTICYTMFFRLLA